MELTLHNGDCLEVMKQVPDKSVDLIICDLPYGCLTGGGKIEGKRQTYGENAKSACAWDIKIDLKAFWEQVKRIRKSDHSPTIHFCTTKFGFDLYASNPDEFRYDLVWDKQRGVSFLSANKMPMRSHEMIYVFSKAGAFYQRKDIEGDGNKRCVLSVIPSPALLKKGNHPTEKSESLYRWLIERYCPPGGTVLDPSFGSGNSVFTAFAMGHSAIGIEKDDKFYKKAEDKLNAL
jgi:site-specific DNA-methyltransferase (adenine-specific)